MKNYCIYFFSFLLLVYSDPLKFSFKSRFNEKNMTSDNVMKMLINNDIFTELSFGSNNQIIKMNIKSQYDSTFILSDSCPQNIYAKKFSENDSDTYEVLGNLTDYYMYEFNYAILSKDNIILFLEDNKKIKINDFKFMLAKTLFYDTQKYMEGMLGLILTNKDDIPQETDFIIQLRSKKIIDSYVFMLDYKDK